MPMHDFRCNKCLYYWEDLWHLSEHDEKSKMVEDKTYPCPECGSTDIIRFFTAPGIKFKGEAGKSGFYALDYANVTGKQTQEAEPEVDFKQKMKDIYKNKEK